MIGLHPIRVWAAAGKGKHVQLGIQFVNYAPPPGSSTATMLTAAVTSAEQAGVAMFTLPDHFLGVGDPQQPMLECYTALGFLAAQTRTITLGALVTGVTYRHAGQLGKTVSTLDVLAEGRGILGIGVAWYEQGHTALGLPFPPVRERFEILEETLQVCAQMWSPDDGPYQGRHVHLTETICVPQPPCRTPILIAGGGEKHTLRLVATYADMWSSTAGSPEELRHKVEVLHRHCATVGRDPGEIRITQGFFSSDPFSDIDTFLRSVEGYAAQGVSLIHLGVMPGNPDPVGFTRRVYDELLPRLAEIG